MGAGGKGLPGLTLPSLTSWQSRCASVPGNSHPSTSSIGIRRITLGLIPALGLSFGLAACVSIWNPESGDRRTIQVDHMEQVYVGAGPFLMGSTNDDPHAKPDEFPQHHVELDSFWIDMTEVTNAQYAVCVEQEACVAPLHSRHFGRPELADHPVIGVTWYEAQDYCEWAGRRLPTEAEWEKAARGVDGRIFPWGNDPPTPERAAFDLKDGTRPVGSYPEGASPYGALDMAGNAWEWVADTYDPDYYSVSPEVNPTGPPVSVNNRGVRGGAWNTAPFTVRAANRFWSFPRRDYFDGFRCASSP